VPIAVRTAASWTGGRATEEKCTGEPYSRDRMRYSCSRRPRMCLCASRMSPGFCFVIAICATRRKPMAISVRSVGQKTYAARSRSSR
jgi:hypothetical protein